MEYKELKSGITEHLNSAAEDFFMVGYFLRQISDKALFIEDGYKSIWEFAKGEYGLSTSSASRFMAINARFSIDGGEHMAEKYIGMGVSKLQEMLGLPDEELDKVTKETTVREIRAMKAAAKEPLSYFGLRKTVRREGSLITTPGCGDGKYDCFSCAHPCEIRQEARQCRFSTCGNPKPCGIIDNEDWKKNIQFSLYKDECQMLHLDLAPKRAGDGEPDACCQNCQNKTCFNRCDVAKEADEAERKKQQAEARKQQQEAEAKKPEPSDADIKAFYDWHSFKATDTITGDSLKKEYRNAGGGGGSRLKDYEGSQRGIRINYKREITWAQLAKRLKEIQAEELKRLEKETGVTEEDFLIEFYQNNIYPSTRTEIKNRDKAAITKLFKQEYGSIYEGGSIADGGSYNCYPDKIVFRQAPGEDGLQITWGRFVTKLTTLLDASPEIERAMLNYDARQQESKKEKEPDIIDADFTEVEEPEEPKELCETCDHEGECVGKKTQDDGCMGYEEKEPEEVEPEEVEPDPEYYEARDVKELLRKHEADLKAYREVGGMPVIVMKKQRILVDALTLFLREAEQREVEVYGGGDDD